MHRKKAMDTKMAKMFKHYYYNLKIEVTNHTTILYNKNTGTFPKFYTLTY